MDDEEHHYDDEDDDLGFGEEEGDDEFGHGSIDDLGEEFR